MHAVATAPAPAPKVVVPIERLDRMALHALAVARSISPDVTAVHAPGHDRIEEMRIRERWRERDDGIRLEILENGRGTGPALMTYLDDLQRGGRSNPVTVVVPEFAPPRKWEYLLHNVPALLLRLRLARRPNTVVISAPFRGRS